MNSIEVFNEVTWLETEEETNDENRAPFDENVCHSTPLSSFSAKRAPVFRSAALTSPLADLSQSFMEVRKRLQPTDFFWSQVTPGAIRFKRRRTDDDASRNGLLNMPNEVVDHIMSFLNKRDLMNFGAVSQRFYQLASHQKHWLVVNMVGKNVLDSALHRIVSRKTSVLAMMSTHIEYDVALLTRDFPPCHLVKLDVTSAKFPDIEALNSLLRRCRNLEYLSLQHQIVNYETLELISRNPDLKVLNLSNCGDLSPKGLTLIFRCCSLVEFNMSWCDNYEELAPVLLNELPSTIKCLAIAGFREYDDKAMSSIIERLPELQELDVSDNHQITAAFITKLKVSAPNLLKLTIPRCFRIEPVAFCLLKNLEVLNIQGLLDLEGYRFLKSELPETIINQSIFQTIAKSQVSNDPDEHPSFWGEDIDEPY
uniref:F-box domain-containing protein n=1 Tax=Panagrolaimus sp. JU765 TaxID=591449 RepID=A0AC34QRL4_9BILA